MANHLIFFGSDRFSAVVLSHLLGYPDTGKPASQQGGLGNIFVVTDLPKPRGRKGIVEPNEVEILANTQNIKVSYYPTNPDELIKFISLLKSWFVDTFTFGLSASF